MSYQDPILATIISVLNTYGPATLKNKYYQGDPVMVDKSGLPACFVTKDQTVIGNESVVEDYSRLQIVLNVVYDLTRDFNQAFSQINAATSIYEMLEARNPDFTFRSDSIAYVLRLKQQLSGNHLYINLDKEVTFEYGVSINKRGEGIFTAEGVCKFEVFHLQLTPGHP